MGEPRAQRIAQELIVRYVAGDREAFQAIFTALNKDVFFVVRRLFSSPFDQEEAQQEVWLHLYRMRRQVDVNRPREFIGWVRRVARNRTIDLLKARGRRPEIPVENVGDKIDANDDEGREAPQLRSLADGKVRDVIEAFLTTLDNEERTFFGHCFVDELSHPEIATQQGITVRRSKYLKKKLLARLIELPGLLPNEEPTP